MPKTKLQPLNIKPETRLKLGMQSAAEETDQVVIEVSGSAAFLQQTLPPLVEAVRKFANVTNAQQVINELLDANVAIRQGRGVRRPCRSNNEALNSNRAELRK